MANAGASIVQVYTSFGFRGVGTPRLIKDEITERLKAEREAEGKGEAGGKGEAEGEGKGGSWKTHVGRDWVSSGQQPMGWDENRLQQESQALVEEARGLAELLRQSNDKEETVKLVEQAERALGIVKEEVAPLPPSSTAAAAAAAHAPVEAAVPSRDGFVIESGGVGAPSIGEALIAEPVPQVDLAPIVVLEEKKTSVDVSREDGERDNEWKQAVKTGPKRLV